MKAILGFITLAVIGPAWGQAVQSPAKAEFEVASVRPSLPLVRGEVGIGVHIDGAQVRARFFSLKLYIGYAYGVKTYQVSGPDWMASERFDITAKLPKGGKREQVPEMMQSLLEKRFQLKMHHDAKQFPVYALVVAKSGLKMQALPPDPDAEGADSNKAASEVAVGGGRGGLSINLGNGSSISLGSNKVQGKKLTMAALAEWLSRLEDRPVLDMTELKGNYDLTLEFSPEDYRAMMIRSATGAGFNLPPEAMKLLDESSDGGLQTALGTLGLKLDSRKASIDILIVDHAEKVRSEN